jgi:hypothetical protein
MTYHGYQVFLYSWIALAVIIFFVLLRITAPYGRHARTNWGPQMSNRLGWILMEVPVLIVLSCFVISSLAYQTMMSYVIIGLFFFHYLNRTFVFPLRLRTHGKSMPILIVASGIFFNMINGFSLGYFFKYFADYPSTWFTDPRFIVGLFLFVAGLIINWKADDILIHLRKPNETHYVIPKAKMFRYISCPNLFGELVEWAGFALLCWNLPALTFFIWTAANLIPRALSHHRWYQAKFVDYPAERKAIIPFVL